MAFDKQHINRLQKEIVLVEKLSDEVGYLVMLQIVTTIFKLKDSDKNHFILKNQLLKIANDVENHNYDWYTLVKETLQQNPTTKKIN